MSKNNNRTALSRVKKAFKLIAYIFYDEELSTDDLIQIDKAKDSLRKVIDNHKGDDKSL